MKKLLFMLILVVILLISVGFGYSWATSSMDEDIMSFINSADNNSSTKNDSNSSNSTTNNSNNSNDTNNVNNASNNSNNSNETVLGKRYVIKMSGKETDSFDDKDEAVEKAKDLQRSVVVDLQTNEWIYSNLEKFMIITDTAIHDFEVLDNAIRYAKKNNHNKIYYKDDSYVIWEDKKQLPESIKLDVPILLQYPELARGCEVTSLAMILSFNGKKVSKMELAQQIKKDPTPYSRDGNGRIYYGNPYDGFVGDIYNLKKNGYGVYHGPVAELAKNYFGDKVFDITGLEFEDVLYFLSKGNPIWVVANSTYAPLKEEAFQMWHTPTGIVKVTSKEHAVVMTGYDDQYIYINDPLYSHKNRSVDRNNFKKAWEQMGNQAIVIIHK